MFETGTGTTTSLAFGQAAVALKLKHRELALGVRLGYIRCTPGREAGSDLVPLDEVDRLRALEGFPGALRERVRTVATAEACRLVSTTRDRFTKLARTGHFTPVGFYLNRYHTVVWLYLATEVREFAEGNPDLLRGRLPAALRARLDDGEDSRARNWRGRYVGMLLRQAPDAWARTAAIASVLDPAVVAEVVDDPYERAHVERLRPDPPDGPPDVFTARAIRSGLLLADDPDEIVWHRMSLALSLDEARAWRPAPRPGSERVPGLWPGPSHDALPAPPVAVPGAAPLIGGPAHARARPRGDGERRPRPRQAARRLLARLSPRKKSPTGAG
ncbi:DUF6397 family protein [Streptomyces sp. NPDC059828]|uniref:DUF6397 family protein n=1 Tax=Streptomyces sp. NPDC059828 TaxID=3346965 RepID=UPI003648AF68